MAGSEPDWGKLVEFCNRVQNSVGSSAMKGALLAIMKRVKHRDEHIQLQALAVSVCVCGGGGGGGGGGGFGPASGIVPASSVCL